MTRARPPEFDLRAALRDRGFTPRAADAPAIVALLVAAEEATVDATRGLAEIGQASADALRSALPTVTGNARVRVVEALGRMALVVKDARVFDEVASLLGDPEPRVRRAAARTLGKSGEGRFAEALGVQLSRLSVEGPPELVSSERRALVEALGKLGGAAALASVDAGDDALLAKKLADATRRARRDVLRAEEPTTISLDALAPRDLEVRVTCRAGLETVLAEEAAEHGLEAIATGHGHATVVLRRGQPLGRLRALRCAESVALVAHVMRGTDVETVAAALAHEETVALLRALTVGPLRFRLEWGTGHARARTRDVATRLAQLRPELVDDPRDSPWEARVAARALLLVPRALPDERFALAPNRVPASSHPTVAAALARVAGAEPDDVVWDPFCGAALDLLERARLGPFARLIGTDTDERALEAARENARLSGVALELHHADARRFVPAAPPTLVLTNPPLGHRMERIGIEGLLDEVLANVGRVAAARARIVWLSPRPDRTRAVLTRVGFEVEDGAVVDLGGVEATLQTAFR